MPEPGIPRPSLDLVNRWADSLEHREESTLGTGSSYPVFCPDLFMSDANSAYIYSEGQRYGQFLMNFLKESFPEIIVPENADCFYDDKKVKEFLHFVYSAPTSN